MMLWGLLTKATGGFYYVLCDDGMLYECRARGLFRKQGISPLVGDRVGIEPSGAQSGYLVEIAPRKNALVRPPLANLDRLVVVASVSDPAPNLLVIDKMTALACNSQIQPVLVVTKSDLGKPDELEAIYGKANIPVYCVSNHTGEGIEQVRSVLGHGISAFSGNSGVGKSSLLNQLDSRLSLAVGETSRKLGRGRHTTRHVELFALGEEGYIADTPGFSAIEMDRCNTIFKEDLEHCFPEFAPFLGHCKFTGCAHTVEKDCAVLEAVKDGVIAPSRHASYMALYEDAKKIKEWEHKK